MVRYFCDQCSLEIKESETRERNPLHRLTVTIGKGDRTLTVEVVESKDGVANAGHFCRYCVIDAINKLDDRPRELRHN